MAISIRPLRETDIDPAERLVRLAFGTMLGLPDPLAFRNSGEVIRGRRFAYPDGALVAERDGRLAGVAISSDWGNLGVFGPLAVDPQYWQGGVARALLEASMPIYERWGNRVAGLFTFAERPVHVRLYQSFGFWARSLTAIMAHPVMAASPVAGALSLAALPGERAALMAQCAALSETIGGLDLSREIEIVLALGFGDVIALSEGSQITGFAVCHTGPGSEAENGVCYVKFAAVARGPEAALRFERLLDACSDFAHRRGATKLVAGVNMACMDAYRLMIDRGFRSFMHGIAMHRPWTEAYDRPDIFALEDWR